MIPSAYLKSCVLGKGAIRLLASVFCARLDCAVLEGANLGAGENQFGDGMLFMAQANVLSWPSFASSGAGCQ